MSIEIHIEMFSENCSEFIVDWKHNEIIAHDRSSVIQFTQSTSSTTTSHRGAVEIFRNEKSMQRIFCLLLSLTHTSFILQRTIRSIQQFLALDEQERRLLLRSLTDEQYIDIMNVLSIYPYVTMNISWKGIEWIRMKEKESWYVVLVFDDENECKITAGALITLTVRIERENMSNVFSKRVEDEEQTDKKEKQEKVRRTYAIDDIIVYLDWFKTNEVVKTTTNISSKSWTNKKKKTQKDKTKKKGPATTVKSTRQSITTTTQTKDSSGEFGSIDWMVFYLSSI